MLADIKLSGFLHLFRMKVHMHHIAVNNFLIFDTAVPHCGFQSMLYASGYVRQVQANKRLKWLTIKIKQTAVAFR
jgi:hypothetical protein